MDMVKDYGDFFSGNTEQLLSGSICTFVFMEGDAVVMETALTKGRQRQVASFFLVAEEP
jgi:hypothetical protein